MDEPLHGRKGGRKIIMLTAYDFQMARILNAAGVDIILVGDSLGVVFQGNDTTRQVTMDDMLYHTRAVVRGAGDVPVVGDMPIGSYETEGFALSNARRFTDAGARGVKLEGYRPGIVRALRAAGISVMGHLGVLPQTAREYKVTGKKPEEAARIAGEAQALAAEGVFSIVLECVTEDLARRITGSVAVPTIGIGAGGYCDGQVLVVNDLLGMGNERQPKFVKHYAELAAVIGEAVRRFGEDVQADRYPDAEHTYH